MLFNQSPEQTHVLQLAIKRKRGMSIQLGIEKMFLFGTSKTFFLSMQGFHSQSEAPAPPGTFFIFVFIYFILSLFYFFLLLFFLFLIQSSQILKVLNHSYIPI